MDRIEKNKRQKVLVISLALLLIISVSYIIFDKLEEIRREEHLNIYQQGFQNGYASAVMQIFRQVSACQQVPLVVGNQTINVYSVECMFQQALNCQPISITFGNQTLNLVATGCLRNNQQ